MSDYTGPERRAGSVTEDRVALMIATAIEAALQRHEEKMVKALDSRFNRLNDTLISAFPGGDPVGHRLAHEKAIRNATWWHKIKSDAFAHTAKLGLWATILFLAMAAWEHVKSEIRK